MYHRFIALEFWGLLGSVERISKPLVAGVARLRGDFKHAISRSLATSATSKIGVLPVLKRPLVMLVIRAILWGLLVSGRRRRI